jgi:hypothetical protein
MDDGRGGSQSDGGACLGGGGYARGCRNSHDTDKLDVIMVHRTRKGDAVEAVVER